MSVAIHGTSARQKSDEPSSAIGQASNWHAVNKEALSRLPTLDIGELRQQWRGLYKTQAPRHLSRGLLVRAVAYRLQELARGGLRPEPQRQLLRIAQHFTEIGEATIRARPELKPGTRLMREWQGRTYDVLVLDDGFSWQSTRYHSALHSAAGWPRLLEPAAGRGDLAGLPTRRAHHDAADRTRSAAGLDRAAQTARQLKPQTRRSAPGHDPTAACALLQML